MSFIVADAKKTGKRISEAKATQAPTFAIYKKGKLVDTEYISDSDRLLAFVAKHASSSSSSSSSNQNNKNSSF